MRSSASMLQIPQEIFRAYDIRGIVDTSLTTEIVAEIGKAIGTMVLESGSQKMVVAKDGRLSGPKLIKALKSGILSSGCDVVDIGTVPTPVLYFATHHLNISSGVMLTGSHNPPDYNGLKIIINGRAIFGEEVLSIYYRLLAKQYAVGCGKEEACSIKEDYINTIKNNLNMNRKLNRPLKVIVDCGNGVGGEIAPLLYQSIGCEVIPLFCDIDGTFPNHHPDPGQPKNLEALIEAIHVHNADIGLAFDGDADRLGVADSNGKIIWPDRLLILFAKELLSRHKEAEVLFDVKCSRHVEKEIIRSQGRAQMWKTGHSLIKAKMKETGALLAGEMSGHIFFKDRWFGFDDGLYSGARLLEILSHELSQELQTGSQKLPQQKQSTAAIFARLPESIATPELVVTVQEHEKFDIVEKMRQSAQFENAKVSTIDGLRVDFDDGFGLVRPSNTGPNLIMRFEGDTITALERIQAEFGKLISQVAPQLSLQFLK